MKDPIVFDRQGYCKLYESNGGEKYLHLTTRLNVGITIFGGFLLIMEVISPCKYSHTNWSNHDIGFSFWMVARHLNVIIYPAQLARHSHDSLLWLPNGKLNLAASKRIASDDPVHERLLRKYTIHTYLNFYLALERTNWDVQNLKFRLHDA